ncbi:AAA family ATPase [Methanobrevibacter smithii]|uniref:AAA family ATPase n=1 Tax=Methanobrevibacter smithii TaxID=2173 RepID=UPI00307DA201
MNNINEFFDDGETIKETPKLHYPEYGIDKFLEEVYIDEKDYFTLVELVKNKKNIIVQGAPGVGKTFMAKRLAYSMMGIKNPERVMMVQFHQSYSYEDFVMGYRPSKEGFDLRLGTFYKFCKKAQDDDENDYFFIIDEINRGNLSKIFGELFMLIENDKRGEKNKIQLLYSDESFFIPKNVYIIGLMNTADRSLAMLDYALRRRFAFFDLKPGFDSDGFKDYQTELSDESFDKLIEVMKELNQKIRDDESLGEGFKIGHSYLCNIKSENVTEKLTYIVEYELIPLLKEYWFDEQDNIDYWSDRLRSVFND